MKDVDREETERWLKEFMTLYKQTDTLVNKITKTVADNIPANLEILLEGYEKLPPIFQSVKELPKPKEKEFSRLKNDFKDVLDACIKAGGWAVKLIQDPSRSRFANIIFFTTLASGIMEKVSKRLASLS